MCVSAIGYMVYINRIFVMRKRAHAIPDLWRKPSKVPTLQGKEVESKDAAVLAEIEHVKNVIVH